MFGARGQMEMKVPRRNCCQGTLVLFRTRCWDKCSTLKKVCGVAFEKAVRRKPLARGTRALCKLNGASQRG
jgi:hypothetical protein